jgi:UDP-N-acetylmuramate: L-alanyl-gamma-D-glutamyl-meso-diaminopimelate ligase
VHVHLIGVCGTGMGALAALFRQRGERVTGSDAAFDPPIGPALEAAGVECLRGYDPAHLEPAPDLVIVGNVIRKDNVEARAAIERDLPRASMSGALREHFLVRRRPVVVCGTHGKTTTSAMAAHLLQSAGLQPGWFIGGIPKNLPAQAGIGALEKRLSAGGRAAPFVVEGDEYDDVFWSKKPKFLDYVGIGKDDVVILTSVEHDHIDIYPTNEAYEQAFRDLALKIPEDGLLVCDVRVARFAKGNATTYGLMDEGAEWCAAPGHIDDQGKQHFDVFAGGSSIGRFAIDSPGTHNIRNALAVLAMGAQAFQIPWSTARAAMATFSGVRRRQDLIGAPNGIRVYDDFAHHPTAVSETLRALKNKHPRGKLFAVFEPRSATACRSLHQKEYAGAFEAADRVLFAPLGRTNVPDPLDTARLACEIGPRAEVMSSVDAIVSLLRAESKNGDTIAILSNGSFGGIYTKLLEALT